jgi:hypothetical protein
VRYNDLSKRDSSDEYQRVLAIEGEHILLNINRLHQLLIRVSLVRAQVEEPDFKSPTAMLGFFYLVGND